MHTLMLRRKYSIKFANMYVKSTSLVVLLAVVLQLLNLFTARAGSSSPLSAERIQPNLGSEQTSVNPIDGSFSYSLPLMTVPGPDGSSFPITLAYNSNLIKPNNDASWVGFGWTCEAGSITRDKIGVADDMDGEPVLYTTLLPPNKSIAVGIPPDVMKECFDVNFASTLSPEFRAYLKYNSQTGYGFSYGLTSQIGNYGSLGVNVDDEGLQYNLAIGYPLAMALGSANFLALDDCGKIQSKTENSQSLELGCMATYSGSLFSRREKSIASKVGSFSGESLIINAGELKTKSLLIGTKTTLVDVVSTNTTIDREHSKRAFGFMYVGNRSTYPDGGVAATDDGDNASQGDYILEKEKGFNYKRAKFLPIPYNAADRYIVSAPGLGGIFRVYQRNSGQQATDFQSGSINIIHSGIKNIEREEKKPNESDDEYRFKGFGTGGLLGYGLSQNRSSSFGTDQGLSFLPADKFIDQTDALGTTKTWHYSNGLPQVFRFQNDFGGSLTYTTSTEPVSATGINGCVRRSDVNPEYNHGAELRRSRLIEFNTVDQMISRTNDKLFRSLSRANPFYDLGLEPVSSSSIRADLCREVHGKSVGEFAVTTESGAKYVYGLPVYQRSEVSVSYGLKTWNGNTAGDLLTISDAAHSPYSNDTRNFIIKSDKLETAPQGQPVALAHSVIKEERPTPKATHYLLTQISSADYKDRTYNGPTSDDYGSYTAFNYQKITGSHINDIGETVVSPWYKWRSPYIGYRYQKGLHSDPRDDMGTVSYGEKEVYYLKTIETKTHVAVFVLNDPQTNERQDALSASADEGQCGAGTFPKSTCSRERYLRQIKLYTRAQYDHSLLTNGQEDEWLERVNFEYDYSLMLNIENAALSNTGKLTLRKVWFEHNGVVETNISPYIFNYQYPLLTTTAAHNIPSEYSNLFPLIPTTINQNPDFSPFAADSWGNYQSDGAQRKSVYNYSTNQNPDTFDPGAWMLKEIKAPTGSSIIVQYEQSDYAYVQNRRAMVMVHITEVDSHSEPDAVRYYLNVGDVSSTFPLDQQLNVLQKSELVQLIRKNFIDQKERMYFKYMYRMSSTAASGSNFPSDGVCQHEYITGYAEVKKCDIANGKIYVVFNEQSPGVANFLGVPVYTNKVPQCDKAAHDFFATYNRNLVEDGDCSDNGNLDGNAESVGAALLRIAPVVSTVISQIDANSFSPVIGSSFLRIPSVIAKRGGPTRVKRMLAWNPGRSLEVNDGGDEGLYGTEYVYETVDNGKVISSGVATNEPLGIRDENALVGIVGSFEDDKTDGCVIAGENISQYEGCLGEELLPSPTIEYSRIVAKNLFQGKSTTGYVVYENITTQESPSLKLVSTGVNINGNALLGGIGVWLYMFKYNEQANRASEGYSFVTNDLHGHAKSIKKYGGPYGSNSSSQYDIDRIANRSAYESVEYQYFDPEQPVPVMTGLDQPLRMEYLGRTSDIAMLGTHVSNSTINGSLQGSVAKFEVRNLASPPTPEWLQFPLISLAPLIDISHENTYTHVTTKLTETRALLKSTRTFKDGLALRTENIAFDPSGAPCIVQTSDGYDGLQLESNTYTHVGTYTTYSVPASQNYPALSQIGSKSGFTVYDRNFASTNQCVALNPGLGECVIDISNVSSTVNQSVALVLNTVQTLNSDPNGVLAGDVNGRLLDLQRRYTNGDLLSLRYQSSVDNQFHEVYYTLTSSSIDFANRRLTLQLINSNISSFGTMQTPDPRRLSLEIVRSGATNESTQKQVSFTVYGQDMSPAVEYAEQLFRREQYANRLNDGLYNREDAGGGDLIDLLSLKQLLTENLARDDRALEFKLLLPPNNTVLWIDPYQDALSAGANATLLNYGLVLREIYDPIQHLLNIGWYVKPFGQGTQGTNYAADYRSNSHPEALMSCNYALPHCGYEKFIVNDDGELAYWSYKTSSTNAANIPFRFSASMMPIRSRVNAFTTTDPYATHPTGILAMSGTKYDDEWDYSTFGLLPALSTSSNEYDDGRKGVWRVKESFIYQADTKGGADVSLLGQALVERNYKGGLISASVSAQDVIPSTSNSKWVSQGVVDMYSPVGSAVATHNILGVPSASRTSHANTALSIAAKNAEYSSISFNSFEDKVGSNIVMTEKHTGNKSLRLELGVQYESGIRGSDRLQSSKISMRYWIRSPFGTVNEPNSELLMDLSGANAIGSARKVASVGEWQLFEQLADCGTNRTSISYSFQLNSGYTPPVGLAIYLDDVRFQPSDANSSAYVYDDKTRRLIAMFDDDLYSMQYQYDAEGKLVRKVAETERGLRTIAEQTSHLPRISRSAMSYMESPGGALYQNSIESSSRMKSRVGKESSKNKLAAPSNKKTNVIDLSVTPDTKHLRVFGKDVHELKLNSILPKDVETLQDSISKRLLMNSQLDTRKLVDSTRLQRTRKQLEDANIKRGTLIDSLKLKMRPDSAKVIER